MDKISSVLFTKEIYPEKILQFGEGNFLRGFVDWMVEKLNVEGLFNGSVVVVQPIENGLVNILNEQDGLYTLCLRGIQNGELVNQKEIIHSISRGINPYTDYQAYLDCAKNPDLRFIISNTTEAGICFNANDKLTDTPPVSFPAKVTALLYERFKHFNGDYTKGMILIPCELIDRNGEQLKKMILQYAELWSLGDNFVDWLCATCHFVNTLVDRIVTGYPRDEISTLEKELGYHDPLLNTAEIFHLWVIEGDKKLSEEIPFHKTGLDVLWTDDQTPYRTRKVRILNGAHTMMVLAAYLYGKDTVKECMDDEVILNYMQKGIFEEIIPTLDLPKEELEQFANAVIERFQNPFIKHYLLSISLNSVSKFKTRVLPSILEYINRKNELPAFLTFSLAALISFYKGTKLEGTALIGERKGSPYLIQDDLAILQFFQKEWAECDGSENSIAILAQNILAKTDYWGMDLNKLDGITNTVSKHLFAIATDGIQKVLLSLMSGKEL